MISAAILHENRSYWTKRSASYSLENRAELSDAHRASWRTLLTAQIADHFRNRRKEDLHILEIGTGPGFFAIILAEAGYHITAIDLTPSMLEEARKNAGPLVSRIDFQEMNAEELSFEDKRFDVIVTRNLTWNLPHPEKAYAEWCRVLKEDGLILNFDANWYNYLFDKEAKIGYEQDRLNAAAKGSRDQNVGENFDIMEEIARRIPLSSITRPAWDRKILSSLGMNVAVNENIWQQVWSEEEKTCFASTPMFMIKACHS